LLLGLLIGEKYMATTPQFTPSDQQGAGAMPGAGAGAGAAPGAGAQPSSPDQGGGMQQRSSQAPATPLQMFLANLFEAVKRISAAEPRVASAMEKISQGIQEAQTALVSPPQPTPVGQQPQY
jgi:hypothetical protein